MNKLSPIQQDTLNPLTEASCKEFAQKLGLDKVLIVGEKNGTWGYQEFNLCIHDELQIAKGLIGSALQDMVE